MRVAAPASARDRARPPAWRRWLTGFALLLACTRPGGAHTFPGITADALFVGDTVVLTLDLHVLDVIAILDQETISGQQRLTRAQLAAGMPAVRAYFAAHVRLSVDGQPIPGQCLGVVADLADPASSSAAPEDEPVPVRLSFLLVWSPPKEVRRVEFAFSLLPRQLAGGVLLATLHRGARMRSQLVEIGRSAVFAVTPESGITDELAGTAGYDAPGRSTPGSAPAEDGEPTVDASGLGAWRLLVMGFTHIIPQGLDHILFVLCLFLLSPAPRPLLLQVTAFTLAHSVTLGLAMAGVVLLPSRLVETLIALSIVVMGVENIVRRRVGPWRWALVFAFGLVHGLGFAGSFSALRLASGDLLRPLLLLNIGIEIGQLTVVAAAAAATCWMWRRPWYTRAVIIPASGVIALVAAWWTVERAFGLG